MSKEIQDAVRGLLDIVARLATAHGKKKFTLDGRLVGDIGEVLVAEEYDVELFERLQRHHDAKSTDGRLVQIKATMKGKLTFPVDHVPDYYLGVQIKEEGTISEVFNGPGKIAAEAVKNRSRPKNNLHSISVEVLKKLQERVPDNERIRRRSGVAPNQWTQSDKRPRLKNTRGNQPGEQ